MLVLKYTCVYNLPVYFRLDPWLRPLFKSQKWTVSKFHTQVMYVSVTTWTWPPFFLIWWHTHLKLAAIGNWVNELFEAYKIDMRVTAWQLLTARTSKCDGPGCKDDKIWQLVTLRRFQICLISRDVFFLGILGSMFIYGFG